VQNYDIFFIYANLFVISLVINTDLQSIFLESAIRTPQHT